MTHCIVPSKAIAASAAPTPKRARRHRTAGVPYVCRRSGSRFWYARFPDGRLLSLRTTDEAAAERKLPKLVAQVAPLAAKRADNRPRPPRRLGVIYFVQATSGPVKVGWTRNMAGRLSHIQTHNHEEVRLLGVINGTSEGESWIHRSLATHRLRGEWFVCAEQVALLIADALDRRGLQSPETARGVGVE